MLYVVFQWLRDALHRKPAIRREASAPTEYDGQEGSNARGMVKKVERLEELAAWHRAVAERAGSAWVWEARLKTAEDLERQAAGLRVYLKTLTTL